MIDPVTRLALTVHTNGVLLDQGLCDLFNSFGVRVGVSLDGDRDANDRHRRFADGRSSHQQVLRALALLRRPEYRHLYGGLLCTVDVANDPLAVYEAMLAEAPPRIDLLFPHATWITGPPAPPAGVRLMRPGSGRFTTGGSQTGARCLSGSSTRSDRPGRGAAAGARPSASIRSIFSSLTPTAAGNRPTR